MEKGKKSKKGQWMKVDPLDYGVEVLGAKESRGRDKGDRASRDRDRSGGRNNKRDRNGGAGRDGNEKTNSAVANMTPEELKAAVKTQVEYYFCKDNLCKDMFLRSAMNEEGWVPLRTLARFNRGTHLEIFILYFLKSTNFFVNCSEMNILPFA
tara:strand:- start:1139 stop:1597 length:459 start_codon:yes stop_codon:yes gene_type:complete